MGPHKKIQLLIKNRQNRLKKTVALRTSSSILILTFTRFVLLTPLFRASTTSTEWGLMSLHHKYKGRRVLITRHKFPHALSKLGVILPLFETVLKEFRWVVLVAIENVAVETFLAKYLTVVYFQV